jgi:cell division protein FtsB
MSALPKSVQPIQSSTSPQQLHPTQNRVEQRTQMVETVFIVGINSLLIGVGIYTLSNLLPHQLAQHQKLQAIRAEAAETNLRIEQLKSDYKSSFSARERQRIAEEQGYLTGAKKLKVNWKQ